MSFSYTSGRFKAFSDDGAPIPGRLYTYVSGTTTHKTTYADSALTVPNAYTPDGLGGQYIALNARGEAQIWLGEGFYSFALQGPTGAAIYTQDGVRDTDDEDLEGRLANTTETDQGAGLVGWSIDLLYPPGTVGHKLHYSMIDVTDFSGVDPTGVASSAAGIQLAIAYAESLIAGTGGLNDTGVGIRFPPGKYNIGSSTLTTTKNGIGFFGDPGRGTYLFGTGLMFDCGDPSNGIRSRYVTFQDLIIRNASTTNTVAAVKLYRTIGARFNRVIFVDWYIGVDGYRSSTTTMTNCWFSNSSRTSDALAACRLQGTDETATTGETYTPGGGWHLTDCEFSGNSTGAFTENCWLIMSADGFYVENSHCTGYRYTLRTAPDATPENCTITDIMMSQVYLDEPSTTAVAPRCAFISGSVAPVIACDVGTTFSRYGSIRLRGVYYRGDTEVDRCLMVQVTDPGGAFFAAGRDIRDFQIQGGTFRQSSLAGIYFAGRSTGEYFEWNAVSISGCYFDQNNSSATSGTGSAITAACGSISITSNTFGADAGATDYVILANVTTSGSDSSRAAALISLNNLADTAASIDYIRLSSQQGARVIVSRNLLPGIGQTIDQTFTAFTTDATPKVIFSHTVPIDGASGGVQAVISGTNADGTQKINYHLSGSYLRASAGAPTFTAGTGLYAHNPDAFGTPPAFSISGGMIVLTVVGKAAQNITWTARVMLDQSK